MKAAQLLEDLSIAQSRRIGGLGDNQRHAPIPAAAAYPARESAQRSAHTDCEHSRPRAHAVAAVRVIGRTP
ncbi:hypothetical protein [Rhodococcus koreensis]